MRAFLPVTGVVTPVRAARRRTLWWAVVLACVLVVAGAVPARAADAVPPAGSAAAALTPPSGLLFGAFVDQGTQVTSEAAVARFEDAVGRKLDVHRIYRLWDHDLAGPVAASVRRGRTPALSVSSKRADGTKVGWAAIAGGAHDAEIAAQAAAVAAIGVPMFLTFQHEPDYATGFGTPAEYRAAWRHYVEVFRARGVTNVVWTWIVTPTPFGTSASPSADALYPGDDVVDWMGLDVYNWFGCSTNLQTSWSSVSTTARSFRAYGQAHGKPLMIAEWGSVEDPADPNRKAAWIRDSMATWTAWPEVKAVLYFHQHGSCPWYADSSPAALAAFSAIAADPAARTRASAYLRVSTTLGSAPLTVTLDGSRSSGTGRGAGEGVARWSLDHGDGSAPVSGTGAPPVGLTHTYAAGTFAARLTVTDASGTTATDTVAVVSAPAPVVTTEQKDVTTTSATLQAVAQLHGYAGTVRFEWGTTAAYGNGSPVYEVPAVTYAKTVKHAVTGLRPGTTYYLRTTTRSPAGTTVLTGTFETAGKPTSSSQYTAGTTPTSTTFKAQVHPHRLPTTAWLEWGTTTALGRTSVVTSLAALTYEKTVASELVTGLSPGTTYYYRVVAQNSSGSFVGPVLSTRTPRS
ncbi:glycosyl hydrolase [Cellulomonas xylanilytica]|uniref:GH26 domain-containing protein n=1 Tax=Cellulomonas xylanilytica TaxID=233583 RepID=A0A510V7B9_9CELL|nr:glycosyl hydrolase [Cellulomonas xylanilytica]GEK22768.1 hypothetical protein CXY01_32880 [Cellulomonas xylanilytica]